MTEKKELFEKKNCSLEFKDGFVLRGKVLEVSDAGIIFQTQQKTSFLNWDEIKRLVPLE